MAAEKLERILKLLAELLNASGPLTADELRTKIGMYPENLVAFRKQFSRDKAALKEMGVPLDVISVGSSAKSAEAYFLDNKRYYLPDLDLTDAELSQLNYASNSIHLIGELTEEEALRKLGGYSKQSMDLGASASIGDVDAFNRLFEALSQRKRASFSYAPKQRLIEPWYLTGREIETDSVKSFRTDRIRDLSIDDTFDAYSLPDAFSGADFSYFSYGDDDEVEAKVLIDKSHVQWVESNLDVPIELNENGDGIAEFVVKNYETFISRVLLLLDHAEILEPDFLRQKLIERLKRLENRSEGSNA
ncbi:MAG: helix-turn-helix transcriptional regulator [Acidimicrobiales bacterium]